VCRTTLKAGHGERLAAVRTHGLRFDVNCLVLFTGQPLLSQPDGAPAFGAIENLSRSDEV
jgi:hypothetical protein